MSLISRTKNIAKNSDIVMRLYRNARLRNSQPELPLGSETELGQIEKTNGKILIATSVGSHIPGTMMECYLSAALALRGHAIDVLLCDSVLPACQACVSKNIANIEKFAKSGPQNVVCSGCFTHARNTFRKTGAGVLKYSDYINEIQLESSKQIASEIGVDDIRRFKLDDISVGEHAFAGAVRFFARNDIENEPTGTLVLKRYLAAAIITKIVMESLLRASKYDVVVFHHGIYVPQGIVGEVCRKHGTRVVNWNPAYKSGCFIFSHDDSYHHTMISEPVDSWVNIPWTEAKERVLDDYLKSRMKGTNDWIWFHENPDFDADNSMERLGIDMERPIIGLLSNVVWDAQLHYSSNAFGSMLDWIHKTIEYFIDRQDLQLLIRVHPAEVNGSIPARQRVADEVMRRFSVLPENVVVVGPQDTASTYSLMSKCDAVTIFNTKTGIELSAIGIPVIVCGEAWIRNKGFGVDVSDEETYYEVLDSLPWNRKLDDSKQLLAKKYAFHFFFRRMIPIGAFSSRRNKALIGPYEFEMDTVDRMKPGVDLGTDTICKGIVEAAPFVYKAEERFEA